MEESSGLKAGTTDARSSTVIPTPPPVVMHRRTSDSDRILSKIPLRIFRSDVGLPSSGLRAWMWTDAAPAFAASMACRAMSPGFHGRQGERLGV